MRKMFKKTLILILISLTFILIPFNNVVNAQTYITLEDFDMYASGVTSGSNSYLSWSGKVGVYLCQNAVKYEGANSLKITQTAHASSGYCYFNLTEDLYITGLKFWFRIPSTSNEAYTQIILYNETDTEIMGLRLWDQNAVNCRFYVYDYGISSYTSIYSSITADTWYQFGMQNNHSEESAINTVYYYIKNDTGVIKAQSEIATNFDEEWGAFRMLHSITMKTYGQNEAKYYYVDFIELTNEDYSGTASGCSLTGYDNLCSGGYGAYAQVINRKYIEHEFENRFTGTIKVVTIPIKEEQLNYVSDDVTDYGLVINGVPCGNPTVIETAPYEYQLKWCDLNITLVNEKPLFAVKCSASVTLVHKYYWYGIGVNLGGVGDSRQHNNEIYYIDDTINGDYSYSGTYSICFYYETNHSYQPNSKIPEPELIELQVEYGNPAYNNSFMVFKGMNIDCYHYVGKNPEIYYYLTDDYLGDYVNYYGFEIRKGSGYDVVYRGQITILGENESGVLTVSDWVFQQDGQYSIVVYNLSNFGGTVDTYFLVSPSIYVCDLGEGMGGGLDTGFGGVIIPNLRGTLYGGIIGAIIIGICVILPMRIQKGLNSRQKLPSFVYVFMAVLGVVLATVLPFFDTWVLAFLIIVSLIYVGARYLIKTGSESEE